jgi:hypothetical protein
MKISKKLFKTTILVLLISLIVSNKAQLDNIITVTSLRATENWIEIISSTEQVILSSFKEDQTYKIYYMYTPTCTFKVEENRLNLEIVENTKHTIAEINSNDNLTVLINDLTTKCKEYRTKLLIAFEDLKKEAYKTLKQTPQYQSEDRARMMEGLDDYKTELNVQIAELNDKIVNYRPMLPKKVEDINEINRKLTKVESQLKDSHRSIKHIESVIDTKIKEAQKWLNSKCATAGHTGAKLQLPNSDYVRMEKDLSLLNQRRTEIKTNLEFLMDKFQDLEKKYEYMFKTNNIDKSDFSYVLIRSKEFAALAMKKLENFDSLKKLLQMLNKYNGHPEADTYLDAIKPSKNGLFYNLSVAGKVSKDTDFKNSNPVNTITGDYMLSSPTPSYSSQGYQSGIPQGSLLGAPQDSMSSKTGSLQGTLSGSLSSSTPAYGIPSGTQSGSQQGIQTGTLSAYPGTLGSLPGIQPASLVTLQGTSGTLPVANTPPGSIINIRQ